MSMKALTIVDAGVKGIKTGRSLLSIFLLTISTVLLVLLLSLPGYLSAQKSVGEPAISSVILFCHLFAAFLFFGLAARDFQKWLGIAGVVLIIGATTFLVMKVFAFALQSQITFSIQALESRLAKEYSLTMFLSSIVLGCGLAFIGRRRISRRNPQPKATNAFLSQNPNRGYFTMRRAVGLLIDYFAFGLLSIIAIILLGTTASPVSDAEKVAGFSVSIEGLAFTSFHSTPAFFLASIWLWIAYFPLLESLTGWTPGKLLVGLRVVRMYSSTSPLRAAFTRHLLDIIDILPFGIVALAVSSISKGHRRLGDIVAGTRVVEA